MSGRHRIPTSRRPRLRWLAGCSGAAIAAAIFLAFFPVSAGAAGDPVTATFSVTGVTVSDCDFGVGGSDVWVKPGQELNVTSSLTGIRLLGLGLSLGSYRGQLVIDPSATKPIKLMTDTNSQKVPALAAGNHKFTWTVTNAAGIPLGADLVILGAGASLHYSGTIHVTANKTKCGATIQLPSVSASASVKGLPPVNVGVPGVKATVLSHLPSLPNVRSLPDLIGGKSTGGTAPASGASSSTVNFGGGLPVPARIVPSGAGALIGGAGGGILPKSHAMGVTARHAPVAGRLTTSAAAPSVQQDSTGKHKTIDLAASKANSTGQFSVILAIVAIIALSVVAATYARLYLLRRETN